MPVKRQFAEALDDRLVPGAGQLPLYSFVRALPAGDRDRGADDAIEEPWHRPGATHRTRGQCNAEDARKALKGPFHRTSKQGREEYPGKSGSRAIGPSNTTRYWSASIFIR
jgi:hypothetical protein